MTLDPSKLISTNEDLAVTNVHEVYPYINPAKYFSAQTYRGKVVLITGASRGIGQQVAVDFAKAGAHVTIVARKQDTLDATKKAILAAKADAQVLTFVADVTDSELAKEAVAATVKQFGHLDVLIANAGAARAFDNKFANKDADGWWKIIEINLRGAYNYIHYAIPELLKSKGIIIATSSGAAQARIPTTSDYSLSKFALNRLIEFTVLENPEIKAFSVHPGIVATDIVKDAGIPVEASDPATLPAAVYLHLASGKADYLNGRYVSVNWNPEEVKKFKDKIVSGHALVAKLSIPV